MQQPQSLDSVLNDNSMPWSNGGTMSPGKLKTVKNDFWEEVY